MKKLALLLGALSLVSSVAYAKEVVPAVEEVVVVEEVKAAPTLTVTNIGQFIEVDNTSGAEDIGEQVWLGNKIGLAYGDSWTFGLAASKMWSMDTDDGIHSVNHRMEFDFWKNFDNFSVGAVWRGESDYDRYLARVKYNYGMFFGDVAVGYKFMNDGDNDYFYSEGKPFAVAVGPFTAGYYYEYSKYNGIDDKNADLEEEMLHQIRVTAPIYTGDKLSLSTEYRYQFEHSKEYTKDNTPWVENNRHIAILNASYAITDALSVSGYYQYEFHNYDEHDGAEDAVDNYYGEFVIGWDYKF